MAKVYSWELGNGNYGYICDPKASEDVVSSYVGQRISNPSQLAIIKERASRMDEATYKSHFENMVAKAEQITGINPVFASYIEYYNVAADCDNLTGPKGEDGRGISDIRWIRDEVQSGVTYSQYEIIYTYGDPSYFRIKNGTDGKNGKDGEDGDAGVATKFVMIYRSGKLNETTGLYEAPPRPGPEEGSWNPLTGEMTYPAFWSLDDDVKPPIFMSSRTFASYPEATDKEWSMPRQISGDQGKPGVDGITTEFIYKIEESQLTVPDISNLPSPPDENGYVPTSFGWTASPTGIDEDHPTEWSCVRKMTPNGWGPWEGPSRWAQWGVNGQDGDGVEYLYFRNNGDVSELKNPTPAGYKTDPDYQDKNKEWTPSEDSYMNYKNQRVTNGLSWTDNPTGVDIKNQFEWVCVRKFRVGDDGKTHVWKEFSDPTLWAKYGENGSNGTSVRTMYRITQSTGIIPTFVQNPWNPGTEWVISFPTDYVYGKNVVWGITAVINSKDGSFADPEVGWEGPFLVTGTKGEDGNPIDYTTTVFAYAKAKPNPPTSNDPRNPGTSLDEQGNVVTWYDYPDPNVGVDNETFRWYQCMGHVDGLTREIKEWCQVLTVNGRDGQAMPGRYTEFRFGVSPDETAPELIQIEDGNFLREPKGWYLTDKSLPKVPNGGTMWMIWALIESDNTLVIQDGKAWQGPRRVSGESGQQGPEGPQGPIGRRGFTGVPGVSLNARYCLGTEDKYDGSDEWKDSYVKPEGWLSEAPYTTEEKPYIWCIQGKDVYQEETKRDEDGDEYKVYNLVNINWGKGPFRLSGINGVRGQAGNRGQVVYPMGIFNENEVYETTLDKAPYVWDPLYKSFYVLNKVMKYCHTVPSSADTTNPSSKYYGVTSQQRSPGMDYNNFVNLGQNSWVQFESFDALYTSVGVIQNGLIGSAVFNNEFMFSQQGIDRNGTPSDNYEDFLSGYEYDNSKKQWKYSGTSQYITTDGNVNPYEVKSSANSSYVPSSLGNGKCIHKFRPNVCINFKTGEAWYGAGKIRLGDDGSGYLADQYINWTSGGTFVLGKPGESEKGIVFENGEMKIGPLTDYKTQVDGDLTKIKGDIEKLDGDLTDANNDIIGINGEIRDINSTLGQIQISVNEELSAMTNTINNLSTTLQDQIDAKVDTYYQTTDPSTAWTTSAVRNEHIGDFWCDKSTQKTYIYTNSLSGVTTAYKTTNYTGYYWVSSMLEDDFFDQFDGKAQVFVKIPTGSTYNAGDLWFVENNNYTGKTFYNSQTGYKKGDILIAVSGSTTTSTTTTFKYSNWDKKDRYTDDTTAASALAKFNEWGADGYVSPTEMKNIKEKKAEIEQDYTKLNSQATTAQVATGITNAYTQAYNRAISACTYYSTSSNADTTGCIKIVYTTTGNSQTYYGNIAAYYAARNVIQEAITTAIAKKEAEAAAGGDVDISAQLDEFAEHLGYSSYASMVSSAKANDTIIEGGYINTSLIDVETLVADDAFIDALSVNQIDTAPLNSGTRVTVNADGINMYATGAVEKLTIKNAAITNPVTVSSGYGATIGSNVALSGQNGGTYSYALAYASNTKLGSITLTGLSKGMTLVLDSIFVSAGTPTLSDTSQTISKATTCNPKIQIKPTLNGIQQTNRYCSLRNGSTWGDPSKGFIITSNYFSTSSTSSGSTSGYNSISILEDGSTLTLDFYIPSGSTNSTTSGGTGGQWWIKLSNSTVRATSTCNINLKYHTYGNKMVIGNNGFVNMSANGYTYSGPNGFIAVYGAYGVKVASDGIKRTSDSGSTWTAL